MDDDGQQATPKKMKRELSDPVTPKKMEHESSDESVSGSENQHTDTQQATTVKTKSKSPQLSVLGTQNHAIDVDVTLQCPLSLAVYYWIKELGLKNWDKYLMNDYWLNDRIINVAMKLMRKITPNFAGLADVILAKKDGFPHLLSIDGLFKL